MSGLVFNATGIVATDAVAGATGTVGATGPTGAAGVTGATGPTGPDATTGLYKAKGSVALVGGTATVSNANATTGANYQLTCHALGTVATAGPYAVGTINSGVSFQIVSAAATETSTVDWVIF